MVTIIIIIKLKHLRENKNALDKFREWLHTWATFLLGTSCIFMYLDVYSYPDDLEVGAARRCSFKTFHLSQVTFRCSSLL